MNIETIPNIETSKEFKFSYERNIIPVYSKRERVSVCVKEREREKRIDKTD